MMPFGALPTYLASNSGAAPEPELQEMINHWVSVIDRWVRKFDQQTGGGAVDTGGPGEEPSLPPDAAPAAVPES
jgi:hypothetical protein